MSKSRAQIVPFHIKTPNTELGVVNRAITLDDVLKGNPDALRELEDRKARKEADRLEAAAKRDYRERVRGQSGTQLSLFRLQYAHWSGENVSCAAAFKLGRQFAAVSARARLEPPTEVKDESQPQVASDEKQIKLIADICLKLRDLDIAAVRSINSIVSGLAESWRYS